MNQYVIMTDSACDVRPELLDQWNVKSVDITFTKDDEPEFYTNRDIPVSQFYEMMRSGVVFRTAAVNPVAYEKAFEEVLRQGHDILYVGFSSALSTTVNSAKITAKELSEQYPNQKITVIDSLGASAGHGLLLYFAVQMRDAGASLEEVTSGLEDKIPSICHWFTVDDLQYLKRGGRIGATAAMVAGVLNVKPILHLDDEGKIVSVSKTRGRKKAIQTLFERYEELAKAPEDGPYFISHGDCYEDALLLENLLEQKFGHKAELITYIGPAIGSHSGPGTLALFFEGKHR